MGAREEIQKRIDRKRAEIAEFNIRIREATVYIQALEDTLKFLPREQGDSIGSGAVLEFRVGSKVAKARDFLRGVGNPQHILDILRAIGEEPSPANRGALSGSLSAYVRKNEVFTRPAPNTFGLIEFSQGPSKKGPPPGFGKDDDEAVDSETLKFVG